MKRIKTEQSFGFRQRLKKKKNEVTVLYCSSTPEIKMTQQKARPGRKHPVHNATLYLSLSLTVIRSDFSCYLITICFERYTPMTIPSATCRYLGPGKTVNLLTNSLLKMSIHIHEYIYIYVKICNYIIYVCIYIHVYTYIILRI